MKVVTYDEVLREVALRTSRARSLSKADIGALVLWKRLNASTPWSSALMAMPDVQVRRATGAAFTEANNPDVSVPDAAGRGRTALSVLPGCGHGDALASALLVAMAPARMAIYDRRAHEGIRRLGFSLSSAPGRYRQYMILVERLAELAPAGQPMSARDVDLALYWLGGPARRGRS